VIVVPGCTVHTEKLSSQKVNISHMQQISPPPQKTVRKKMEKMRKIYGKIMLQIDG